MSEFPKVLFCDLKYTPRPLWHKLTRGRWQPWRAVVLAEGNYEPLFVSSEAWTNKQDAIDTIRDSFGPTTTVFLREAEHGLVLIRRGVLGAVPK